RAIGTSPAYGPRSSVPATGADHTCTTPGTMYDAGITTHTASTRANRRSAIRSASMPFVRHATGTSASIVASAAAMSCVLVHASTTSPSRHAIARAPSTTGGVTTTAHPDRARAPRDPARPTAAGGCRADGARRRLDAQAALADRRVLRAARDEHDVGTSGRELATDNAADRAGSEDDESHACSLRRHR